jgi:Tol biopolymer transport system component
MNADGSGQRNLTRHPANDFKLSWSLGGRRIAFVSDRQDGGRFEVYVMNASGG